MLIALLLLKCFAIETVPFYNLEQHVWNYFVARTLSSHFISSYFIRYLTTQHPVNSGSVFLCEYEPTPHSQFFVLSDRPTVRLVFLHKLTYSQRNQCLTYYL